MKLMNDGVDLVRLNTLPAWASAEIPHRERLPYVFLSYKTQPTASFGSWILDSGASDDIPTDQDPVAQAIPQFELHLATLRDSHRTHFAFEFHNYFPTPSYPLLSHDQ